MQQQNKQTPINTPSNKPSHKPSGSFNSNDKRKTILGEPNNNNSNNNDNNDNNNNYDYTNNDNARVDNDNDDVSLSEEDNVHCSRRTRKQPDRLSYSKRGEVAELLERLANMYLYLFDKAKCMEIYVHKQCEDLRYEFIEQPKTILAAYYAKFQKLSYDLDLGTIEDEMPISLLIRASEKDDLTWAKARGSGEFELFKKAAREEIVILEKKGS